MKLRNAILSCIIPATIAGTLLSSVTAFSEEKEKPHAQVFKLDGKGQKEMPLLSGPPATVTMRSGLVTLVPGQSVGKHSTGQHEEMLVVFEGEGKMLFHDGSSLVIGGNHALYCPPETEHDVVNTGTGVLRYVYIVASTK
jgi:mannose-6-phosphate isomerase-like protein (cupin superfamily)